MAPDRQSTIGQYREDAGTGCAPVAPEGDGEEGGETVCEAVEVPAYYAREIQEREQIARECPIDVFCSSTNPRWGWPYKLVPSNRRNVATRESSDVCLIDPGAYNPACLLEIGHAAWKTDADLVLARDLPPTHPGLGDIEDRHRKSIAVSRNYVSQHRAMRRADSFKVGEWECAHDADVIVPIQPPYEESIAMLGEPVEYSVTRVIDGRVYRDDSATTTVNLLADPDIQYYAVGGLLAIDDVHDRIAALQTVRDALPDGAKVHALGPGTNPEMLRALRRHSGLVDSLDNSTPESAPANGKVPDRGWHQHDANVTGGVDSSTTRALSSARICVEMARQLTPGKYDEYEYDVLDAATE